MRLRIFAIACALVLSSRFAAAQDVRILEPRVDSLFAQYTRGTSPGVAVAIIRDGRVFFEKGYGFADIEHRVPMSPSTVFDIASVSKQFTGLAVSMLIDQGRIAVADTIRKYLPEMYAFNPPITVYNLLHHTSGLRDWPGMLTFAGWNPGDVISFEHILTFARNQHTLNFTPGAEYTYSNTNYNLLAEIVARVSGKSFRAFTDSAIFRPLGMMSTHFRNDLGEIFPNRSYSYTRAPDSTWRLVPNQLMAQGSSSLFSTADDLAKWLINFGTRAVGGTKAIDRMLEKGKLNDGKSIDYGFGVTTIAPNGVPVITHNGGWAGYSTFVAFYPKTRDGVVLLANTPLNPDVTGYTLAK